MKIITFIIGAVLVSFNLQAQKCKIEIEDGDVKQHRFAKLGSSKGFTLKIAAGTDGSGDSHYLKLNIARTGAYFTVAKDQNLIIEFTDKSKMTLKSLEREVGRKKGVSYALESTYWIYGDDLSVLQTKEIKQITVYTDNGYFPLEFDDNSKVIIDQMKCLD